MPGAAFAAETGQVKVFSVVGQAEILDLSGEKWLPLTEGSFLKKGARLRTEPEGAAEIQFDPDFQNVIRMDENSRLDFLSVAPPVISLERGRLFMLREENASGTTQKGKVLTPFAALDEFFSGGCVLEASKNGLWIKMYGGSMRVTGRGPGSYTVEEGFKLFLQGASSHSLERMRYPDYLDWQAWLRKIYEKKDDHAAETLEKLG